MSLLRRGNRLIRQATLLKRQIAGLGELPDLSPQERSFQTTATSHSPLHIEDELFCRQRSRIVLGSRVPYVACDVFVAPNAIVVGDVDMFDRASVWYGCVLRGDLNNIKVGSFSNIQDRTIVHAARTSPTGLSAATSIGRYVTIGQGCLLRSTTIEHESVIGDKCILMEGSLVESHCVLAPGTVVTPGRLIPFGQLWAGNPARFVRNLTNDEKAEIKKVAEGWFEYADKHRTEYQLDSFQYVDAEKIRAAMYEGEAAAAGART